MVRYYETKHIHPFAWDQVALYIFRRYPNPFATHVLSEDTLHRELLHGGRTLYTRRFLTKTNKLPSWGEKFLVNVKRYVPLVEESVVDLENKVITTYTRNVGLSRFMSAVERVEYVANPDNPSETIAKKEAWVESSLYGLRSAVKSFGIERFKKNCHRATEGFNHVLTQVQNQQAYLKDVRDRNWQAMKNRGELLKEQAKDSAKHAASMAKVATSLKADGE